VSLPDSNSAGPSRKRQFLVIIATVLALSSAGSHLVVHLLGIRTDGIERSRIAAASGKPALVIGSSLTFFGVSFPQVAKALPRPLITRSVGGCSPCELEPLAREVPEAARTIIGVSIFDLDEDNLCDARPALVPIQQTVRDLVSSRSDWPAAKRVVWSYPLPWVQKAYPVAGYSSPVIVTLRDKAGALLKHSARVEPEARLSFKTDEDTVRPEKLSDWDAGRVVRNLSQLRAAGLGHGHFAGPKALALGRILDRAAAQEPPVVIVFPVSPPYRAALVTSADNAAFEEALARARAHRPDLVLIRLDQEPALQPATVFWDLVHLNDDGRRLATQYVIDRLSVAPAR
jgi:hypothetical protein